MSSSLVYLNLDFDELGDEGVAVLMQVFSASRNVIEFLSLNDNDIESVAKTVGCIQVIFHERSCCGDNLSRINLSIKLQKVL